LEGSLDKVMVNRVFEVVVGKPGIPRWLLILIAHVAKTSPRGRM
jgi:hypothetical protein